MLRRSRKGHRQPVSGKSNIYGPIGAQSAEPLVLAASGTAPWRPSILQLNCHAGCTKTEHSFMFIN